MGSDILSYTLIVGAIALPLYVVFLMGEWMLHWTFEAQSIVVSLPIP